MKKMKNMENLSDSDSENEMEVMRKLMEAADPMLFSNGMYHPVAKPLGSELNEVNHNQLESEEHKGHLHSTFIRSVKSERNLSEEDVDAETKNNTSESTKSHIYKKLSELIGSQVEFINDVKTCMPLKTRKVKSKIRLLYGFDCYVKPYEEFEFLIKGQQSKPTIKRRNVDQHEEKMSNECEKLQSVAVSPSSIYNGLETKNWAQKPDRKNKVFYYKQGINGQLYAKKVPNEFT